MSFTTDPNVLLIYGLIFVLGLLVGVFLTAGGRRKWRERYNSEYERRRDIEKGHAEREKHWVAQEKEWRERESVRSAPVKSGPDSADDPAL
jgi:hypothetical protein